MPTRVDHVIVAAPDLDLLERAFAGLGFTVVGGGTHPHLGTRNRIIVLGDSYIELLAIADVARVSPVLRDRIAQGRGWVGYALQSADIATEAQAMRERGVDARGPVAGQLVAPDGTARSWRVVTIGSDDLWAAALPLPFLIQHDSAGERHRRELAGADALAPHANGATRLLGVTLESPDLSDLRHRYERAYELTPAQAEGNDSMLYPLTHGAEWIRLREPISSPVLMAAGADIGMSVRVGAPDLTAVERAIWRAGLAATQQPGILQIALPTSNATLEFSALSANE